MRQEISLQGSRAIKAIDSFVGSDEGLSDDNDDSQARLSRRVAYARKKATALISDNANRFIEKAAEIPNPCLNFVDALDDDYRSSSTDDADKYESRPRRKTRKKKKKTTKRRSKASHARPHSKSCLCL